MRKCHLNISVILECANVCVVNWLEEERRSGGGGGEETGRRRRGEEMGGGGEEMGRRGGRSSQIHIWLFFILGRGRHFTLWGGRQTATVRWVCPWEGGIRWVWNGEMNRYVYRGHILMCSN